MGTGGNGDAPPPEKTIACFLFETGVGSRGLRRAPGAGRLTTRSRPERLARHRAVSAWCIRSLGSASLVGIRLAIPMLAVTRSKGEGACGRAMIARSSRWIFHATRRGSSSAVFGNSTTNSSTPCTPARRRIADPRNHGRKGFQAVVAGNVAVFVIVSFEVIDIEPDQGQRGATGLSEGNCEFF